MTYKGNVRLLGTLIGRYPIDNIKPSPLLLMTLNINNLDSDRPKVSFEFIHCFSRDLIFNKIHDSS